MTENEAKEMLAKHYEFLRESWKPHPDEKILDAIRVAISSIDKIQQYRVISAACEIEKLGKSNLTGLELAIIAVSIKKLKNYEEIGTEEECREAVLETRRTQWKGYWIKLSKYNAIGCPKCSALFSTINNRTKDFNYCPRCGQRLEGVE